MGVRILAMGHYAPAGIVSNIEIESRLGLERGWIESRTGIRERRYAADGETLSGMAVQAAEMALAGSAIDRGKIALTLLATSTPDHLLPPSSPLVAHRLGLSNSGAIDLAGACAGFLYALTLADAYVRAQGVTVLVIAANILSRRINPEEKASSVLFSDAAGAIILGPSERLGTGVLGQHLASDGSGYDYIKIEAGGSREPFMDGMSRSETLMRLSDGKAVFTKAVAMMAASSRAAIRQAGLTIADIDHWIPHQANTRIIEATRRQLGIGTTRVVESVTEYGNSSAASIPFTMSLRANQNGFKPGHRVLLSAAGAGLTGGAVVWGL